MLKLGKPYTLSYEVSLGKITSPHLQFNSQTMLKLRLYCVAMFNIMMFGNNGSIMYQLAIRKCDAIELAIMILYIADIYLSRACIKLLNDYIPYIHFSISSVIPVCTLQYHSIVTFLLSLVMWLSFGGRTFPNWYLAIVLLFLIQKALHSLNFFRSDQFPVLDLFPAPVEFQYVLLRHYWFGPFAITFGGLVCFFIVNVA